MANQRTIDRQADAVRVRAADAFNHTRFSRFLNSGAGRAFRFVAGLGFLAIGLRFHRRASGIAALVWSVFPLTAGGLDVCYISAALGGPFSGAKIRQAQQSWDGAGSRQRQTS